MVKHVDVAIFDVCKMETEGKFASGHYIYGLKEGGVGLSEMKYTKDKIPPDVLAKIEEMKQKIIKGEIVVPDTLEKVKDFKVE
jgi:basic membrane protein A and related proteins